jgi:hypothetical protein
MSRAFPSDERFVGAPLERNAAVDEGVAELTGAELLQLPVRSRGIKLGRPVDLIIDLQGRRVLALEVRCGDEATRLLPIAAARIHNLEITVSSALVLVDERGAAFYRERATTLRDLRERGELADIVMRPDGAIVALVTAAGRAPVAA